MLRARNMRRARAFGNTSCEINAVEIKINSNNVHIYIDEKYVCKLMFEIIVIVSPSILTHCEGFFEI
jgi:hypothetical protein